MKQTETEGNVEAVVYEHLEKAHMILSEMHLQVMGEEDLYEKCCNAKNCIREAISLERTGKSLSYFATSEKFQNLFS